MPGASAIEWTEASWNPATGCTKVSPGCAHCYAETFAERWRGIPGHAYEQGFDLKLWPQRLAIPLRWRKPRVIFVNSMSDLFHEEIPDEFIAQVFAVMAIAKQHTFQVLTKRPERMRDFFAAVPESGVGWVPGAKATWAIRDAAERLAGDPDLRLTDEQWDIVARPCDYIDLPLPNVWLGTTIENRRYVQRADLLRETPAAVRFVSAEPLLGPLSPATPDDEAEGTVQGLSLRGIDRLICGGESGPKCRRFDLDWARDLRDACLLSGTAFFLKQLGGHPDKRGGDQAVLDGRRWLDMPGRLPLVGAAVEPAQGVLL